MLIYILLISIVSSQSQQTQTTTPEQSDLCNGKTCPANSICNKEQESYKCECNAGYYMSSINNVEYCVKCQTENSTTVIVNETLCHCENEDYKPIIDKDSSVMKCIDPCLEENKCKQHFKCIPKKGDFICVCDDEHYRVIGVDSDYCVKCEDGNAIKNDKYMSCQCNENYTIIEFNEDDEIVCKLPKLNDICISK